MTIAKRSCKRLDVITFRQNGQLKISKNTPTMKKINKSTKKLSHHFDEKERNQWLSYHP
jgi:frataxin-like iron-binding protein CyaY